MHFGLPCLSGLLWVFLSVRITSFKVDPTNPMYLPCDDLSMQRRYFEQQRVVFDVDESIAPLDMYYLLNLSVPNGTGDGIYLPMTCVDKTGERVKAESFVRFGRSRTKHELQHPIRFSPPRFLSNLMTGTFGATMWMMGWDKVTFEGNTYLYHHNPNTNNILFHFHGIGSIGGLETTLLFRNMKKQTSIYILLFEGASLVSPDASNDPAGDLDKHLESSRRFIDLHTEPTASNDRWAPNGDSTPNATYDYRISGQSFGTIQITAMCKQYPQTCLRMTDIILIDPLTIDLPFSRIASIAIYGVFVNDPTKTPLLGTDYLASFIRLENQFNMFMENLDWYEWSIDSLFIRTFSEKLVMIIGTKDHTIDVKPVPIFDLCRTIYTDTYHATSLLLDMQDWIQTIEVSDD